WDLLILDEAHHLCDPGAENTMELATAFAARVPGLLLLTATPDTGGTAMLFGLLQLLDPHRFHDPEAFRAAQVDWVELVSTLVASATHLPGTWPTLSPRACLACCCSRPPRMPAARPSCSGSCSCSTHTASMTPRPSAPPRWTGLSWPACLRPCSTVMPLPRCPPCPHPSRRTRNCAICLRALRIRKTGRSAAPCAPRSCVPCSTAMAPAASCSATRAATSAVSPAANSMPYF